MAAKTWLGEAEGAPISLLRKWPHKSDRETHLWMLVKVLLLITSKVSEAERGSWGMESSRPGSRCQLPPQQSQALPCGLKQPRLLAAHSAPHTAWGPPGWGTAHALFPLVRWKPPPSFSVSSRAPSCVQTSSEPSEPFLLSPDGTVSHSAH